MCPRTQCSIAAMPRRQRGAVLVLVAVALLAILAMGALAMDGGHMLLNKARLQSVVDAAALSGAKTLSKALDDPDAYINAAVDARQTFEHNTTVAGNAELATAMANAGGKDSFVTVEFSASVYGAFVPAPAPGTDVRYVRVSVPDYPLTGFLWGILQLFGDGDAPDKSVAAIATAGPSPTAAPCDLSPLVVCGVEQAGTYYGYQFGDLEVLKTAANDESLANGNYQLLDFGSGAKTVGEQLAGGGTLCPEVGDNVPTKPGNTVGQAISGLNTRMNEYDGSFKNTDYPPDLVVSYDKVGKDPALSLDDAGVIVHGADKKTEGVPVSADSSGNIYYTDPATAQTVPLLDYNDWKGASSACLQGTGSCTDGGVFERRILKIVVGNCSGLKGGATQVPVLGFGCFFLVQPGVHTGGDAQIFGQFVKECEGDGVAGPTPVDDQGPLIIQLYKTFLENGSTPSNDS
ncbi:pilus assembly protein TadG-related protein [Pseudomonas resinovorans]|uniref:pilus assembly protein TadG-related protein n=1 Tax=Metapseudomonas resinovorans TaxID=53412 RepID=UPI00237F1A36|nr:pilus assembly protein TadG-related protein [Pseudomonas resinovorans]MDE3739680.1 pilus assembly protein TadG-related protein [Pseudomonas resinovorans]